MPETQQLCSSQLPTLLLDRVFHVGTLNPADKGNDSYEGAGLSISLHPNTWRGIALLGTEPTWKLERADARFLDFHSLSSAQRNDILAWGAREGYVEEADLWEVSWFDDELGNEVRAAFLTEEEAMTEAGLTGEGKPTRTRGYIPTAKLLEASRNLRACPIQAFELVCPLFAEQHGLDGVWWEDTFDPLGLSCPRGVIVLSALDSWGRRIAEEGELPDEDDC